MRTTFVESLGAVAASDWNALVGGDHPFLRHEFLAALEEHGCLGERWGWLPRHLLVNDADGRLVGAAPLYLKYNSYGEFVFDWSWAEAYQRRGLRYYPKLVSAIPYTPATGPRLLVAPDSDPEAVRKALLEAALEKARAEGLSSLHWLFTGPEDTAFLEAQGLMLRAGCQFHWNNRGYRDFDDYLEGFSSHNRKKLRRERRRVQEAGVELEVLGGAEITDEQWRIFHRFYTSTFHKHGGHATLSESFFRALGHTLPDNVVLVLARHGRRYVAAAFNLRSADTLYGRHWGCEAEFHSLHFEACYYAGIDYAIAHGLRRFEPGAQGEHKVGRGFEPTATRSAHWVAHPGFAAAVRDFVGREHGAVEDYMLELAGHLPFKHAVEAAP